MTAKSHDINVSVFSSYVIKWNVLYTQTKPHVAVGLSQLGSLMFKTSFLIERLHKDFYKLTINPGLSVLMMVFFSSLFDNCQGINRKKEKKSELFSFLWYPL